MLESNILNIYKNILDFFKSALAYLAVLSAFTMFFGFISLYVFLWASDYLWIINNVDYKTIAVWGFPTALAFFGFSLLGSVIYKERSKYEEMKLSTSLIIFLSIVALILIKFFMPNLSTSVYTSILGIATTIIGFSVTTFNKVAREHLEMEFNKAKIKSLQAFLKQQINEFFNKYTEEELEKARELLKVEEIEVLDKIIEEQQVSLETKEKEEIEKEEEMKKYERLNNRILIYIFILFVAATIWSILSAKWQSIDINARNYQILAEVGEKQFGVLINNGTTFILVDLDNKKLRIVSANKIESLTERK